MEKLPLGDTNSAWMTKPWGCGGRGALLQADTGKVEANTPPTSPARMCVERLGRTCIPPDPAAAHVEDQHRQVVVGPRAALVPLEGAELRAARGAGA